MWWGCGGDVVCIYMMNIYDRWTCINWIYHIGLHHLDHIMWVTSSGPYNVGYTIWTISCGLHHLDHIMCTTLSGPYHVGYIIWTILCGLHHLDHIMCTTSSGPYHVGYIIWTISCGLHHLAIPCGLHHLDHYDKFFLRMWIVKIIWTLPFHLYNHSARHLS